MIRKAFAKDLDQVAAIYEAILDQEEATGHHWTNWQRGVYPCRATAEKALAADTLYVEEEGGHILGCANLNQIQPRRVCRHSLDHSRQAQGGPGHSHPLYPPRRLRAAG